MAPAAGMQESSACVPKHTLELLQSVALDDFKVPTTSATNSKHTVTATKYITITLFKDFSPLSSLSPRDSLVTSTSNAFQWLNTHGIIPGSLRVPPQSPAISASLRNAISSTTAAASQPRSTLSTLARRLTYPRPSPSAFLNPEALVPRAVYKQQQRPNMASGENSNMIWYRPYGLEALIFTVMFLGFAWVVLMWLINFPPLTWNSSFLVGGEKDKMKERRPLDKPLKYSRPAEVESKAHASTTSAQTPAIYLYRNDHLEELSIELKHHGHHGTEHRRSYSNPTTAIYFSGPRTPAMSIESPPNPFLHLPNTDYLSPSSSQLLQSRASSEWLAQHAAFFSNTSSNSSCTPSRHSNQSFDDDYDIKALETGTAPLTHKTVASKTRRRCMSWMGLGLGKVEGVVNGFVGKVAKWTDDEGGEERVLLPVVGGRNGVKIE